MCSKKLGIMQPYFFPYIGYWQLMNAVDTYVVYDDVAYIKGGWINRNNILMNGAKNLITIPLKEASSFKNINEIELSLNDKGRAKLLKTITFAYSKAPYFKEILPIIEKALAFNTISDVNISAILSIKQYLGMDTEIVISSNIEKNNDLKAQDKVLHICELLGATEYYNAIGGQELYSKEDFLAKNINLKFVKTGDIMYNQFNKEFVSGLSIIDVLMFNSKDEVNSMLSKYELV